MPDYDFSCQMCGIVVSVFQPISTDGDITGGKCQSCQIPLTRVFTANPVHFKGMKWGHQ